MSQLKGATMIKMFGVVVAAVFVTTGKNAPGLSVPSFFAGKHHSLAASVDDRPPLDVNALLAAAKGAPPLICSLAAQSVGNNWGNWSDAPSTPLGNANRDSHDYDFRQEAMPAADVQTLLQSLSSEDPCVREISVRVVTRVRTEAVVSGLISRLTAESASLREVSSLGL